MTFQETAAKIEFLKEVDIEKVHDALSVQEQVFEKLGIDKSRRRQPRCYLKKFIDWCEEYWIRENTEPKSTAQPYMFHKGKSKNPRVKLIEGEKRGRMKPYALGKLEGDFINLYLQA